jgi:flagellar hook-length control protein FliK
MSDLFIKPSAASDKSTHPANGQNKVSALAGLAGSFKDLIQKAGARIESGISALTGQSTVFGISKDVNAPRSDNHFNRDYSGDDRDYANTRTERNDHGDDHASAQRTDRDDTSGRNDRASDDRGRGDNVGNSDHRKDSNNSHSEEKNVSSAPDDSTISSDNAKDNQVTAKNDGNTDNSENSSEEGKAGVGKAGVSAGKGETTDNIANTGTIDKTMGTVLSEMIAAGQATGETEVASTQGAASNADGIVAATQNIAASAASQEISAKVLTGSDDKNGNANQSSQLSQSSGQSNAQVKTVANGPLGNGANAGQNKAQSTIANQASDLAKAIGEGNRAQVNVSVTNESQNLTSRPNASLFSNSNIVAERLAQSTSGQQTSAQTQNSSNQNIGNQLQNNQAGGVANGMVQSQAASATVGSAARTGGGEGAAKTGGASTNQQTQQTQALNTSSGSLGRAGGGEGINQPGGVTANQQTQQAQAQSAAQEAKNADKPVTTGRSMVEQISVKVTKALESGIDKINIQLRPAHMGRVEVKLEMSQDNRLSAMVVVDNRETLETLKNDSRALQRSLLEAGLNTDSGDLNFSLRGEEQNAQDDNGSSSRPLTGEEDIAELEEMIIEEAIIASDGRVLANGRIDVRA